jgi:diguanylate cyclase (GGDEF)-like protein
VNAPDDKSGIVLQCDQSGEILRVIRDDLGITAGCLSASTLFGIVDPESREKAQAFLRAAIEAHATFGWEVNVQCNGQLTGLLLVAGLTDVGIIICGTRSRAGLNALFDEMMKIQNEEVNALRKSIKEEQLEAAASRQHEQESLEEFSRLNNELVNTQRELARRNAELAVANARLESLATTDGLTGLKNHRAFQESLAREYARAARDGSPLSLLMLDVDHFKQFNDQFGHPAGDAALQQVARILTKNNRLSDTVAARYGGEEFALILPHCGCDEAAAVAERVRRAVELGPSALRPVTVSLGAATMIHGTPDRAVLIARADAAMYLAKVRGRNQVCTSSNDVRDAASACST